MIGLIIGLLIGLPTGYYLLNTLSNQSGNIEISNQRIVCSAFVFSSRTINNGPVVAYYYPDGELEPNFVPMPQSANLSLRITNNVSKTLYDIVVEVKYKTSEGSWNTTSRTVIDRLGNLETKNVNITLANPAIIIENSRHVDFYDPNYRSINETAYVLSIKDHEIVAYGFAARALSTSTASPNSSPTELVAALNIVDRENNLELMQMFPELNPTYRPDCLWINGNVTNTGKETAYNAGLKVVAGGDYGILRVNITVPLSGGAYGTDNATNAFVLNNHRLGTYTEFDSSPWKVDNVGSMELGSIAGGQTSNVTLAIFHLGRVTSWSVTPVWTSSP